MNQVPNGKQAKILALLGKGLPASVVAGAVGVSESYVSQLMSEEGFSNEVSTLRVDALEAHTNRDLSYDSIEDKLLAKLDANIVYMRKTSEILSALRIVGNAPRRGTNPLDRVTTPAVGATVIHIELPTQMVAAFRANKLNQVVEATHTSMAGELTKQSLVTIPSGKVEGLLNKELEVLEHEDY